MTGDHGWTVTWHAASRIILTRLAPEAIHCGTCGAVPGDRCRTPSGLSRVSHDARWTSADRISSDLADLVDAIATERGWT